MQGGFYRVNVNSNLTVLTMNSVAFSAKNNNTLDAGQ
jgi:hypothetical protein